MRLSASRLELDHEHPCPARLASWVGVVEETLGTGFRREGAAVEQARTPPWQSFVLPCVDVPTRGPRPLERETVPLPAIFQRVILTIRFAALSGDANIAAS